MRLILSSQNQTGLERRCWRRRNRPENVPDAIVSKVSEGWKSANAGECAQVEGTAAVRECATSIRGIDPVHTVHRCIFNVRFAANCAQAEEDIADAVFAGGSGVNSVLTISPVPIARHRRIPLVPGTLTGFLAIRTDRIRITWARPEE